MTCLLEGRVVLVTGAGAGIGRACALRFAAEGADVVIADIDEPAAEDTAAAILGAGGKAEPFGIDLADTAQLRALVDHVDATRGILHVLHNNAGLIGGKAVDIDEIQDGAWQAMMDVNLRAPYYLTAYALPLLRRAAPRAAVLFTSSTSGIVGSRYSVPYSTTKGGIVLMVRSLADRLGPEGIRVNALCPGPTATQMPIRMIGEVGGVDEAVASEQLHAFAQREIPLQRIARVEEQAAAALFLVSDEASFVHGVALPVDGGLTAR